MPFGVQVLRGDDPGAPPRKSFGRAGQYERDLISAGNGQRTARTEVVLHVDDNEGVSFR